MSAVTNRGTASLTEISFNIRPPAFQEHRSTNFTHIKALDLLVNLEKARDSASTLQDKGLRYISSLVNPDAFLTGYIAGIAVAVTETAAIIFKPPAVFATVKAVGLIGAVSFSVALPLTIGVVVGVAAYYFYSKQQANNKADLETYLSVNKETLKGLLIADIEAKEGKTQEIVGTFAENVKGASVQSFRDATMAKEEADFAQEVLAKFFTEPAAAEESKESA